MPATKKLAVPRPRTRNGVEPFPKMVAAALRDLRKRDGDEAFDRIARLTFDAVAGAILAKDGPKALHDLVRYF
jgi:hypothetical protein